MAKNKKFLGYGILLSILGIVFMFLYSGLQNDQINIIQSFSGWSGDATMAPMTVGNFVCIVLTFLYGTMFIKFGVKKSLIPTMILCAVGCIGVAAANGLACNGGEGNYVLLHFFIHHKMYLYDASDGWIPAGSKLVCTFQKTDYGCHHSR